MRRPHLAASAGLKASPRPPTSHPPSCAPAPFRAVRSQAIAQYILQALLPLHKQLTSNSPPVCPYLARIVPFAGDRPSGRQRRRHRRVKCGSIVSGCRTVRQCVLAVRRLRHSCHAKDGFGGRARAWDSGQSLPSSVRTVPTPSYMPT